MHSANHRPRPSSLLLLLLGFCCSLQSLLAQAPSGVSITPSNQVVSLGGNAGFTHSASGEFPRTYEWRLEGVALEGATNGTLVLTNVGLEMDGGYDLVVKNALGAATSQVAVLRVNPTFEKITRGPLVEDREPSASGSWGDYDNDGLLDLFVANSSWFNGGYRNSLYRNLGGGEFLRVTNAVTSTVGVSWGGLWADYDNDGDLDLYVIHPRNAHNELFRNEGGGVFTPLRNAATTTSAAHTDGAWVDHDGDGWLDLFLTTQTGIDSSTFHPEDFFFRNRADGSFSQWSSNEVGMAVMHRGNTYAAAWCDVDRDGDLDLYVPASGSSSNSLYRNDGGWLQSVTAGSLPETQPRVAACWGDFNNDGLMDLVTSRESGSPRIHVNRGDWRFEDLTELSGISYQGTVYFLAAGDYDDDGDLDLYVPAYNGRDILYANRGDATFEPVDVGSPLADGVADGATWVDYDNDGFLDLFKSCGDLTAAANQLFRNNLRQAGNTNSWLKLRLKGTVSNASAIGARIRVRAVIRGQETVQVRQITTSLYGSASSDGLIAHFGLGDATNVDLVQIDWPSGNSQILSNEVPSRMLAVTEPVLIAPVRPTGSLGGTANLRAQIPGGVQWQWYREGVALAAATNSILGLTNLVTADERRYSVVATLADGTTQTNSTYVFVDNQFVKVTEGPEVSETGTTWTAGWGDLDDDGDPDMVVPRYLTGLSKLYSNDGTGRFVSETAFLPSQVGTWFSPIIADFDNDGRSDCFLSSVNTRSQFYFQGPGHVFTTVTSLFFNAWNVCAFDYDRDGLLDLYFSGNNRLLRNLGGRAFEEKSIRDVGAVVSYDSFGGACTVDYDDDGWVDVYAPHLSGTRNYLFRNVGGRFVAANNAIDRASMAALAGAWGDYDNDGRVDLAVSAFGGVSRVFRNLGDGEFGFAPIGVSIAGSYNSASWADYDNDGFLDLFMTYGNAGGNSLYRNNGGGTFTAIKTGSIVTDRGIGSGLSYAGLWFDANNDGFLDLYVVNGNDAGTARSANFYYRNRTNGNHWLQVRLHGTSSNPQGIGAKVRARATVGGQSRWQRRDITAGDQFNGNQLYAHFGLGSSTVVNTLRVEWPSGTVQEFNNVAADQVLTITEPRQPEISSRLLADGSYQLEFTTEAGRSYDVQASDDLDPTGWTTVVTVTGTGSPMQLLELVPLASHRFYRVVSR